MPDRVAVDRRRIEPTDDVGALAQRRLDQLDRAGPDQHPLCGKATICIVSASREVVAGLHAPRPSPTSVSMSTKVRRWVVPVAMRAAPCGRLLVRVDGALAAERGARSRSCPGASGRPRCDTSRCRSASCRGARARRRTRGRAAGFPPSITVASGDAVTSDPTSAIVPSTIRSVAAAPLSGRTFVKTSSSLTAPPQREPHRRSPSGAKRREHETGGSACVKPIAARPNHRGHPMKKPVLRARGRRPKP